MESFEKFHPLLTQHFKLDWPNSVPLKEIQLFNTQTAFSRKRDTSDLAQLINQAMQDIMKGEKLFYAITEQENDHFVGITSADFNGNEAYLRYRVKKQYDLEQNQKEIFDYLFNFLKENFAVTKILSRKIDLCASKELLKSYGFQALTADQYELKLF